MKFSELREFILSLDEVSLKTLQRFCGKCISMSLAVPGCKLFCREINVYIFKVLWNSGLHLEQLDHESINLQ
jgi:hypothetical protein